MDPHCFEIRECISDTCQLRFSSPVDDERRHFCPLCHQKTILIEVFGRHDVALSSKSPFPDMAVVLDNIRSTWNVGAMFRSADGCGINHIYLCGITPTPAHAGVMKTSLGAEKNVEWSQHRNGIILVQQLKKQGFRLWALEGGEQAESLFSCLDALDPDCRIALVVGNELCGVDPGIIRECERIVFLPMTGVKNSLNVAVAFGIAAYLMRYGREVRPLKGE